MEIRITVTGPRWLRLPRRRSARLALACAAALVLAVPVAWATDRFSDVPGGSPHHDDVNLIAGAGITGGCNPPANTLYCPDQFVRRDQMGSFLGRGLGRIAVSQTLLTPFVTRSVTAAYTPVAVVHIAVGGVAGATQYVKVDASLNIFGTEECRCEVRLRIRQLVTDDVALGGHWQTVQQHDDHTFTAMGVFDAAPGLRSFQLEVWYMVHAGPPPETGAHELSLGQPYLVATTFPFTTGSSDIDSAVAPAKK